MRKRRGSPARTVAGLILCVALVYGVVALLDPWALHIGGRWTPLMYWSGTGTLATKGGNYPVYLYLYPSAHFSRLRPDGLRPTGGVQGQGWLCTSRAATIPIELSGTIYGGWRSTENSLIGFRLLERRKVSINYDRRGYVDLYGRWRGPELVMDDRGRVGLPLRSGASLEHASVTLDYGDYSDFKAACAAMTDSRRP